MARQSKDPKKIINQNLIDQVDELKEELGYPNINQMFIQTEVKSNTYYVAIKKPKVTPNTAIQWKLIESHFNMTPLQVAKILNNVKKD